MPARKQTIKMFAHDLLVETNFIDIYGRAIGYDYDYILARIKAQFPEARTTRRLLQDMAYIFNRTERLPVRRRSRRALALDFAMSLLMKKSRHSMSGIRDDTKRRFPDQTVTLVDLQKLSDRLTYMKFEVPSHHE